MSGEYIIGQQDKKLGTEVLNADDLGKSLEEVVSLGCKFVVEGDVFKATIDLIDKLMIEGSPDKHGAEFLMQLRFALLQTSKPVRERLG